MESQSETIQTALKLPMLKTGDYDLWSMRIEQYLTHTDYALWEVIVNGDAPAAIASVSGGAKAVKLISQLEIHSEVISQEDANLKLLRSLPPAWNTRILIMRNKSDLDTLSYDNQVFTSTVFDCDDLISSDSDVSLPPSIVLDRYQSGKGYHAVPPPYTGTFMPPKSDLVFYDAPTANETVPTVLNVELSSTKPNQDLSQTHRPSAPIIEDWVSDSEDDSEGEPMPPQKAPSFVQTSEHVKTPRPSVKPVEHLAPAENFRKDILKHVVPTAVLTRSRLVLLTAARPVTTVVPHINVTRLRPSKTVITKPYSSQRRPIHHRPSHKPSNFPQKITIVKAPQVNAIKGVKGNWGNPQHALKDKGVINSGCSRHMIGNISYLSNFEEIKGGYVAFGGNPKCGKIIGKFDRKADEGFLVGYSISSKDFRVFNSRTRIAQETLHINFIENQPNVAGSEPTWLFDIDTLTQSINYQPVVVGNQPNSV
nr:ribonuclease H-like domain-containing protein [Tanacetum cinerariifolium]